jgi:histidinol-phosphate phosphatase family protein
VVAGPAAGPAAARNRGWQSVSEPWVAFLDDDVVVDPSWLTALHADLLACSPQQVGSQGVVRVPLRAAKATDWERNVGALAGARWITADCAYRRSALAAIDGFDERFPRAYREDADLALRLVARGGAIAQGRRRVQHPVRPADPWISVRLQAGNADDALMDALHGPAWRERAGSPRGAFGQHVLAVGSAVASLLSLGVWLGSTAHFAWRRIAPGPRDAREIVTMAATSVAIPFAAVYHYARGRLGLGATLRRTRSLPVAVLFDRDGTLIEDDPALREVRGVRPVAGAREALDRLRAAGIALGVVTNQPRVGEGDLSENELAAIHAHIDDVLGPFQTWNVCTHARTAECACRKPRPELVLAAAKTLGIAPSACVVVGDIGSDVEAATAAGARSILVPTVVTRAQERERAPVVARNLRSAVDLILHGRV